MARNFSLRLGLASAVVALGLGLPAPLLNFSGSPVLDWEQPTARAQAFGQQEVDQSKFILVASPYGGGAYKLLVLEQVSDARRCWSENGSNPTIVDPLLLNFDFTGTCGRGTDSNSYSLRMAGRDYGLLYSLNIVKQNNDLVLVGTSSVDRNAPPIEIGRTNGIPSGTNAAKININPGWRLTKRTQDNKVLGHVYLTTDTVAAGAPTLVFTDVQRHWAKAYVEALSNQNIITGFPDGSFRPEAPVTRVQFAAIVNKAFASTPAKRAAGSFKDIPANYWGLQAIQSAYERGFMSGYPDGTFKSDEQIPRVQVLVSLSSGLGLNSTNSNVLSFYEDAAQIPAYANPAVAGATEKQIVINYPKVKQLSPNRPATRAEVAAFVYQALVSAGQLQPIASPYVVNPTP